MDQQHVIGIILGGIIVAVLGGIAEYMRDKENFPNYKGFGRDFLIGSVLVLFLLQILPESMENLFSFLPSIKSLADSLPSVTTLASGNGLSVEPELQVGPARF